MCNTDCSQIATMIDTLTSLRLIFALLVFLSHLELISDRFSGYLLTEGYVGVSFFFILSGFIIAYNYLDKLGTYRERRNYYISRIARIYPLHILTTVAAIALYGFSIHSPLSWIQLAMSATMTNAYIPRSDFFFAFNAPAWSLCCEQLFYITFPLIIPLLRKQNRMTTLLILAAIAIIIGGAITPEAYSKGIWYVNPFTRYPEFIIGILIFLVYRRIKGYSIGKGPGTFIEIASVAMFMLFYVCGEEIPKVYRYSIYYWIPISAIILSFSLQKGALSGILSRKIFLIGGEISYGIYLIQLLVINSICTYCKGTDGIIAAAIAFAATIIISYISHRYYEIPMNRRVKEWLGYRKNLKKSA